MKYFDVGKARRCFALKFGVLGNLFQGRRASRVRRFVIQDEAGVVGPAGLGGSRNRGPGGETSPHPIPRPRPGGTGAPVPWRLVAGVGV